MRSGLLLLAGLSGFIAVCLGAFAAHGLTALVSPDLIKTFKLGVEYQFYHTFALIGVALAGHWLPSRVLDWSGYLFILGMLLFSGSLYAYVLTQAKWLVLLTPLGGSVLLVAWLLISVAVWRNRVTELN